MKLHYKAKFDGNVDSLPHGEHKPGAVRFKEPEDPKKLGIIANGIAVAMLVITFATLIIRGGLDAFSFLGCVVAVLMAFPHEILHASCFKGDVYLYTNLQNGLLFVTGPEDMSKARFVFMSLLPNIVFGVIPFAVFLVNPELGFLGSMGAAAIPMGAGDYFNVFNAIKQMPGGARTYLYGFNSYWYMP